MYKAHFLFPSYRNALCRFRLYQSHQFCLIIQETKKYFTFQYDAVDEENMQVLRI